MWVPSRGGAWSPYGGEVWARTDQPPPLQVGGYEAYLLADEDNEAAEVYRRVRGGHAGGHWPRDMHRGRQVASAWLAACIMPMHTLPQKQLLPPQAEEEESGVLNVSPAANTLSLVLRDEGLMKFVK